MIAILGAGHLALRLIPTLSKSHSVRGSTRSEARLSQISEAGAEAVIADLDDEESLRAFLSGITVLVFSVAPRRSGYDAVYGEGLGRCLKILKEQSPKARCILITSTAVYDGYDEGQRVNETTPAKPVTERSRWLHKGEVALREALGHRAQILRLAGLYSKGRGPFNYVSKSLKSHTPLRGHGAKLLNLIHEADAAALILEMIHRPELQLVLGADGAALTRAEAYGLFARSIDGSEPRFEESSDGLQGRDCRPSNLPITLQFPSFPQALSKDWS